MSEALTTRTLPPADPAHEKGRNTWEWKFPEGPQVTIYRRPKGMKFGAHFHKGDDPSKNPERFLLLSGVMEAEFMDQDGNERRELLDASRGPVELVIQPWVLHRMEAREDCTYIEYRVQAFDPAHPDTYPASEFPRQFPS